MAVIEPEEFGVSNSILLDDISEKSFIANLKYRFARGRIYTYIGEVVVSVNPYRQLNIYSDDYVFDYRAKEPFERPPHIYAIADSAFHDMRFLHNDSCIVIGGESGSGKTEASKYVMHYIATMSQSMEIARVKNLLIVSNPLLEAFGNAQTVRNDNSSRFGKYMHITFTVDFKPKGGLVRTYLLEKARVVKLQPGERNFHCFYHLLAGASDRLIGDLQLVRDPSKYRYLSGSNRTATDEHMYSEVLKSMMSLRFTKTDIEDVRCILAAILHLGNVKIEKDGDGESSRVANKKPLNKVATLLGTSMESVARVLTHRMVATKVEVVEAKLNAGRAHYTRDSLAKALYERLFQLIVSRVNRAVSVDFPPGTPTTVISVLDIYGFEVLGVNSFEQFCINYCNERLQQMFIKSVLKKEQEVYRSEGVEWVHISFQDNEPIYTMIESMITAMNDECLRPGEEDDIRILNHFDKKFSETEGYGSHASGNKDIVYNEQFQVTHYAGYVVYDIMNFMDKNKDTQFQDLKRMLYNCELSVLKEMFPEGANPVTDVTKRPITVGTHFKNDVCDLIELLENQTAHFIRCIMPNTKKSPNMWNDELILNQVRYLGLVENTKVRRAGYPYRMKYERFEWRYKMIDPMLWPTHGLTAEQATQKIIATYHLDELVVFGRTQIFFKAPKTIYFLESEREKHLPQIGLNISRWVVGNHIRRKVRKMKALMSIFIWYRRQYLEEWFTEVLENFKDCSTMPDYGKSVEWPHPPPALALGHRLLKKVHINWWARTKITSLSPRDQYEVRLKTVGYKLLYGKKSSLQLTQRWVGDELGREDLNPDAAQFVQVMTGYQDLNGDRQRLYSCHVIKLNRHMHSNPRVFVLCDKFLYWLKTNYQFSNKAPVELGQVTGLSISPGNDQALVVHCVSSVGDFIFYLQNDRPASELLSAIWNIYYRKYRKRLPVNVTTNMKFSRPNVGIREGVLFSDPGQTKTAKSPSFIKVSGGQNRVSIVWPDDSAVSANPRSYL